MADSDNKKPGHTLADHLLGQDFVHDHDGDADHDHDHFDIADERPLEENPIWIQDHVTLVTVGIDIGSSGTQVIFSASTCGATGKISPVATTSCPARPCSSRRLRSHLMRATSALTRMRWARSLMAPMRLRKSSRTTSTPAWSSSPGRPCDGRMPRPSRD